MFSYTGLTPCEVEALRKEFHIYILSSGRISIAGCEWFPCPDSPPLLTLSSKLQ